MWKNPHLRTLKKAKAQGMSARKVWKTLQKTIKDTAARDGWRPSELAATLASWQQDILNVYGKKSLTI